MKAPRHAEIWLPGYLRSRSAALLGGRTAPKRLWLTVTDHYEPFWRNQDEGLAASRVALWETHWPAIARRNPDSSGRPARYSFFYPQEEYRPQLLDVLARMEREGLAGVEIHLHHDGEGKQNFIDRMSSFRDQLHERHGLLRRQNGRIEFGFIHGNYALDNSRPDGKHCGLNDELRILSALGCYADFTMPSGASPTQARMVNEIYWAKDDPERPKSYDSGVPVRPGSPAEGDLLIIPGPFGVRWAERLIPRIEYAEIAGHDLATEYRVRRWLELAPRIGGDVFVKLHTHGTQERNSKALLLEGGLDSLDRLVRRTCETRGIEYFFVTAHEMWKAVDALRAGREPDAAAS
jgi:hypothetical protein